MIGAQGLLQLPFSTSRTLNWLLAVMVVMFTEFVHRLAVISHSPVDVYIAGNNSRYWYPYRLQHVGYASDAIRENCLRYILDSNINDGDVTNEELLDAADDLNAHYVVPKDYRGDQSTTTNSVRQFLELYEKRSIAARPLIPLQPPYIEQYENLNEHTHYALGGISNKSPERQLKAIRSFRSVAGDEVYVHVMGVGASMEIVRALRTDPWLVDSLDVSSPEQLVLNDTVTDKTLTRIECPMPHGVESTTVRAGYMQAVALTLNYLSSPLCADEEFTERTQRATEANAMEW